MNELHLKDIAEEFKLTEEQVIATAKLIAEGATVPFIARYRKEITGGLDEVAIAGIRDRFAELKALDDRRGSILKSLTERKLLTDELKAKVEEATTLSMLEDVYQPYRPKRRTRAMIAIEKGLQNLADFILENQGKPCSDEAQKFVAENEDESKSVADIDAALAGARDILAERFSDDTTVRTEMREKLKKYGVISTRVAFGKEEEGEKYKD
jgi:uncharacterized protein